MKDLVRDALHVGGGVLVIVAPLAAFLAAFFLAPAVFDFLLCGATYVIGYLTGAASTEANEQETDHADNDR